MSNKSSHLIGEPLDPDDELPPDDEQRAYYLQLIQDRQRRMTLTQQTTTPPRHRSNLILPKIPLEITDTPQGPIIAGEPRLASFRKKAERANRWITGSEDVVDLLTGYPNLPGNLEAAHAAPRDTGYTNWTINRSVETILGLAPASLHYDTISNGFMVFIHVHKLYDNGFVLILPILPVTQKMDAITKVVERELLSYQARLAAANNSANFDEAKWRKEELELRLWVRSQWQDFDDNHAKNGTYYRVYPTSLAVSNPSAHKTPITQLRPKQDGGPITAQYPWTDLQSFLCHVHPRFFIIDSIFKTLRKPCSSSSEDLKMFGSLVRLWKSWTLPPTTYFNDDALDVLEVRQVKIQSKLRPVIRQSLPKLASIPSTPNQPLALAAALGNQRIAETAFLGPEEDNAAVCDDDEHQEDDMGIEENKEENKEVEGIDLFDEGDADIDQVHRSSSPDQLDSIWPMY